MKRRDFVAGITATAGVVACSAENESIKKEKVFSIYDMENLQLTLTIFLIIIEVIAFAWLIIDIQKSKKNQHKIIELEHQILKVEDSIIELEKVIVEKIDILIKLQNK